MNIQRKSKEYVVRHRITSTMRLETSQETSLQQVLRVSKPCGLRLRVAIYANPHTLYDC